MGQVEKYAVHLHFYYLVAWCFTWVLAHIPIRNTCDRCRKEGIYTLFIHLQVYIFNTTFLQLYPLGTAR